MQLFPSLTELRKHRNNTGPFANIGPIAVIRLYLGEENMAPPALPSPEQDTPVWLLQHTDTDETVAAVLGAPLDALIFTKVRYFPDEEWFVCHLDRGEQEGQLVIPDSDWLDIDFRQRLVAQL